MWPSSICREPNPIRGNPLVHVVRPLDFETRRALHAATERGVLRRGTWAGCAFNQAGAVVARPVSSVRAATRAFDLPRKSVVDFVAIWDALPGTDRQCTILLREALLEVGLEPVPEPVAPIAEVDELVVERALVGAGAP